MKGRTMKMTLIKKNSKDRLLKNHTIDRDQSIMILTVWSATRKQYQQ